MGAEGTQISFPYGPSTSQTMSIEKIYRALLLVPLGVNFYS